LASVTWRDGKLHALAIENLAGIDIAFRIDGDHCDQELAAILARTAHLADHLPSSRLRTRCGYW
jgi:hypothetical protein